MIETRVFDVNPAQGTTKLFHYDHSDDTFAIETIVDVEPIVEDNKIVKDLAGGDWKGDWHHVASIPLVLLPELEKLGIMTVGGQILDEKALRRWLNERDNQAFRTKGGRI